MSGTRGRYVTDGTDTAEPARHQHRCLRGAGAVLRPAKTGDTGGGSIRHGHIVAAKPACRSPRRCHVFPCQKAAPGGTPLEMGAMGLL